MASARDRFFGSLGHRAGAATKILFDLFSRIRLRLPRPPRSSAGVRTGEERDARICESQRRDWLGLFSHHHYVAAKVSRNCRMIDVQPADTLPQEFTNSSMLGDILIEICRR